MNATIIDRGRGPEIDGTRITVYTIMDFFPYTRSAECIAEHLELTVEQVQAALDYIREHRQEVDDEYEKIMARIKRGNPPWITATLAKSPDELRQRLLARNAAVGASSDSKPQ
jgi:uncharacterized protein (DUF433 family)